MKAEKNRLKQAEEGKAAWGKWGPYLTERQWGTVREDYSPNGTAWDYITHDMARSKAYRWGEDGIGGLSDDRQFLCFSLALWNGRDPILKERLFGLSGDEGNHGEDVKEIYYYLDSTPTHSYLKMLYKYPQAAFPYDLLVEENRRRGRNQPEFELIDTGVFDEDRYFDVFMEYAKADPEDILIRITAFNRGPEAAVLHLLPLIWFRNTWTPGLMKERPLIKPEGKGVLRLQHPHLGDRWLYFRENPELLFCDNETNGRRLYGQTGLKGYFKDEFHEYVVKGDVNAVNPEKNGTRASLHYNFTLPAGGSFEIQLRLCDKEISQPFGGFSRLFAQRKKEADDFYADLQAGLSDEDMRNVQRQAFAGMLWSKQFYDYDVTRWLEGDPPLPQPPPQRWKGRNREWLHLKNADIISMPDKWEYPWYAAWDSAFHCLAFSLIDPAYAKDQLLLFIHEWYMHPNGQLPAYEWAFGDVNPPVHAWAAWRVYKIDKKHNGNKGDLDFLERVFHKLLLNFTWWVNRKDEENRNIFQGGFLGLDNIGLFDRSKPLPTGGHIEQSDGTSWMAMYCLNLMRIALELAYVNPVYQDLATKFFEHFLYIAKAMFHFSTDGISLWDEQDEFYYDVLHLPDGNHIPLRIRSMVGLIPLFAVETLEPELLAHVPEFKKRMEWFLAHKPEMASLVSHWHEAGSGDRRLLSLLRGHRMKKLLYRMLDENEFLSDYGIRALSRYHQAHPYNFYHNGETFSVSYQPAESDSNLFGGNSNWRGPIWFPVNFLLIESLQKFHHYYGDDFKIEYPTGSGKYITIEEVSIELTGRLCRIFLRDGNGRRPVFGGYHKMQEDPHFRDYLLFHEYFHGDNGAGLGASHQTGWTGLVAKLLHPREPEHH
ncbi:MAG: glucosidase [Calditrichia bacterium]